MQINFEGQVYDLPDDATEEEIQFVLNDTSDVPEPEPVYDDLPEMLTDEESALRTAEQKATKEARPTGEKVKDYLTDKFLSGGATDVRNMLNATGVGMAGPGLVPHLAQKGAAKFGDEYIKSAKEAYKDIGSMAKSKPVAAVAKGTGKAIKGTGKALAYPVVKGLKGAAMFTPGAAGVDLLVNEGRGTKKALEVGKKALAGLVGGALWLTTKWAKQLSEAEERGPAALASTDYLLQQTDEDYRTKRKEIADKQEEKDRMEDRKANKVRR